MNKEKTIKGKDFLKYYVKPHSKISREVVDKDLKQLMKDAHIMYNLCYTVNGNYAGGFAVHHSQINEKDPMNFFVTHEKEIIINPKIINHTKVCVDSREGCLSFADVPMITVPRFNKVTVEYQILTNDGKLGPVVTEHLNGRRSLIFQHETDHGLAKYIYGKII